MELVIPIESIVQSKGGVILYDPDKNEILNQYVHDKEWNYHRVGWRGGAIYNKYLIATDWTDLHFFNLKKWKYEKTFKKNTFNDLHYLTIFDNKLYVVNTGLDAIEIFNDPLDPKFEKIEFVFKACSGIFKHRKINLEKNYNKMFKIKPHVSHPNSITVTNKLKIVTCFRKDFTYGTGEIVDLNSGKKVSKHTFDCHDGVIYNGDFYTSHTKFSTILKFDKIRKRPIPYNLPSKRIKIGPNGWWRGMVIHDDKAYVFSSDGYKARAKCRACLAIVDLNTNKRVIKKIPVGEGGINWDTVYQPLIWKK